jgi:hypothetical protein
MADFMLPIGHQKLMKNEEFCTIWGTEPVISAYSRGVAGNTSN